MSENGKLKTGIYKIRVEGLLEDHWSEWLEEMSIAYEEDSVTVLTGTLVDQPSLHGVLNKIRDLGLVLLSVGKIECEK